MCLQLGITDPEKWLESVPDRVLACWLAYDEVEPIGCDWERHASLLAMLDGVTAACINPHVDTKKAKPMKPRSPAEFLPKGFLDSGKKRRVPLAKQLELFARAFGGNWKATSGNHDQ